MLAFIKSNYQIGDTIEVTCSEGVIAGQIEYVNNKYIVLRQSNGKVCGIAASDIRTFTADSPVPMMPCNGKQATVERHLIAAHASHLQDLHERVVSLIG